MSENISELCPDAKSCPEPKIQRFEVHGFLQSGKFQKVLGELFDERIKGQISYKFDHDVMEKFIVNLQTKLEKPNSNISTIYSFFL